MSASLFTLLALVAFLFRCVAETIETRQFDCAQYYTVKQRHNTCQEIATSHGLQLHHITLLNPSLNCSAPLSNIPVCVRTSYHFCLKYSSIAIGEDKRPKCVDAFSPPCSTLYTTSRHATSCASIMAEFGQTQELFQHLNPNVDCSSKIPKGVGICTSGVSSSKKGLDVDLLIDLVYTLQHPELTALYQNFLAVPTPSNFDLVTMHVFNHLATLDDPTVQRLRNYEQTSTRRAEFSSLRKSMCKSSSKGPSIQGCFCDSSKSVFQCTARQVMDLQKMGLFNKENFRYSADEKNTQPITYTRRKLGKRGLAEQSEQTGEMENDQSSVQRENSISHFDTTDLARKDNSGTQKPTCRPTAGALIPFKLATLQPFGLSCCISITKTISMCIKFAHHPSDEDWRLWPSQKHRFESVSSLQVQVSLCLPGLNDLLNPHSSLGTLEGSKSLNENNKSQDGIKAFLANVNQVFSIDTCFQANTVKFFYWRGQIQYKTHLSTPILKLAFSIRTQLYTPMRFACNKVSAQNICDWRWSWCYVEPYTSWIQGWQLEVWMIFFWTTVIAGGEEEAVVGSCNVTTVEDRWGAFDSRSAHTHPGPLGNLLDKLHKIH